jgi:hypothetical protein
MVDLSDLEGRSAKGRPFAEFDMSSFEKAIGGLSTVEKAMKEAGGFGLQEAIEQLTLGSRTLKASDIMAEQIRAINAPLGAGITDRLAELDTASAALRGAISPKLGLNVGIDQDLLDRINRGPDLSSYLEADYMREPFIHDFPDPPPNPIWETNALLEKLSTDFEDMKAVTAATADVQEKQAILIGELLKASVEGAAAQERAAKETLRVARISMWTSLVAVVLMMAGLCAQALLG